MLSKEREAQNVVSLEIVKDIQKNVSLKIEHGNPLDSNLPLNDITLLEPGQKEIKLISPVLPAIHNYGVYLVAIKGYGEETDG